MLKDQAYIKDLSRDIIDANQDRNRMLEAMDGYYQSKWELPQPMSRMQHIHKVVTTDPHDAVRAGTRVLSALTPNIKIAPLVNDEANRIKANEWEQVLKWYFINASMRRRATVLSDMVMSALLYDMIAVQISYLPYQAKVERVIKLDSPRYKMRMRNGPFVITVHNPQNVYPIESAVGLEAVVSTKLMRTHEVYSEWGDLATGLRDTIGNSAETQMEWVTVFDYWDNEQRYVWGVPGQTSYMNTPNASGGIDILSPTEHELGWIPWAVRQGGTMLFNSSEHRLNPMLYSVYQSGQWETQNIAETLAISEIISYAQAPRGVVSGPTPDGVIRDFGEPGNMIWEMPGHQYRPEQPPQMDSNLFTVVDRVSNRIDKSTVARILQNADIAPNTAFSTLNLATQTALGSLKPYKHLTEVGVSDVITLMLLWIQQDGEIVSGYGADANFQGQQITINPDEIDPASLYIDVSLDPDVPTDRLQRINAGRILQSMGVSVKRSLEEAGITDPEQAIKEGYFDQWVQNRMQIEMQNQQRDSQLQFDLRAQGEMQMQQAEIQMQIEQMMMEFRQQMQGGQQQGIPEGAIPPGGGGPGMFPQGGPQQNGTPPEGLAMSPNQGGLPAAQFAPEATREQITGEDRAGMEF